MGVSNGCYVYSKRLCVGIFSWLQNDVSELNNLKTYKTFVG